MPGCMATIRQLEEHPELLAEAWEKYLKLKRNYRVPVCGVRHCNNCGPNASGLVHRFIAVVNGLDISHELQACSTCHKPEWEGDAYCDVNGNVVCSSCRGNYTSCQNCDDWSTDDDYFITWVSGRAYCESCRDDRCTYCDDCDEWYLDENADYHEHHSGSECGCEPQPLHFKILANSHGELEAEERLLVELPDGLITDQAVAAAIQVIWEEQFSSLQNEWDNTRYYNASPDHEAPMPVGLVDYNRLVSTIRTLEPVWQTKRGNYTRRLSAALYKELGVKLNEGVLSRVGSTIRSHTSMKNAWHIELTRDLNQSAEAFFNSGSCWWGSESQSLCALKSWGGFALRTYRDEDSDRDCPTGRAWVQPLNKNLRPTSDIYGAHAYVVYNGYGELEGYTGARLLAYLTSKTYKKIRFSASYQYVNSGGYLIADQETCDQTTGVDIDRNPHEKAVAA